MSLWVAAVKISSFTSSAETGPGRRGTPKLFGAAGPSVASEPRFSLRNGAKAP